MHGHVRTRSTGSDVIENLATNQSVEMGWINRNIKRIMPISPFGEDRTMVTFYMMTLWPFWD